MSNVNFQRVAAMRRVIEEFLSARLTAKIDKIKAGDADGGVAALAELEKQFEFSNWIADAAHRVSQIQSVTHSLKPIHPDARGTSLYCLPNELPSHELVGSYCLGSDFEGDVVGNAAALDVFKFLTLQFEGHDLLSLMQDADPDLTALFGDEIANTQRWMTAFTSIAEARGVASSHVMAKQIFWLIGNNATDDSGYQILAPLFATSLAHRVYQTINDDRFGDASKLARQARKDGQYSEHVLHDYPNMAVQKLGGTKPQNISQLNSERRGDNYLLASLPPRWKSVDVSPLLNTDSMFTRFGRRFEVKQGVVALLSFLKSEPAANLATRERRDELVRDLACDLLAFGAELRTLPPGWSLSPDCQLTPAEKHWLDPDGVAISPAEMAKPVTTDINDQISQAFARWLNRQLRDPLPMGDPEFEHWRSLARDELTADEWELIDDA